jgi:hypothetical protein
MNQHHHHNVHRTSDVAMDRRFLGTIVLNATVAVAEFVAGMLAGSLAMLSDAAHNLGDVVAIALALVARLSASPTSIFWGDGNTAIFGIALRLARAAAMTHHTSWSHRVSHHEAQ